MCAGGPQLPAEMKRGCFSSPCRAAHPRPLPPSGGQWCAVLHDLAVPAGGSSGDEHPWENLRLAWPAGPPENMVEAEIKSELQRWSRTSCCPLKQCLFNSLLTTGGSVQWTTFLEKYWAVNVYGHESEQTQGDSEGQGSLACCSSWGHRESDTTLTTE